MKEHGERLANAYRTGKYPISRFDRASEGGFRVIKLNPMDMPAAVEGQASA